MQQTARVKSRAVLVDEEIDFPADEILASATDFRGVIRYANPVFYTVARYTPDELVGAPHKVIRHPDMPRGVFYLFWERLKAGLPVCAYVKNRAGDGRYYWVFATVTQLRDGYVSVRIKPQADLFPVTREIYADLLTEEANGLSPEKSARRLCEHLKQKGFADYDAFMTAALDSEFMLRRDADVIGGGPLGSINELNTLIEHAETLVDQISEVFRQVRGEPVNLRILAGRMEESGTAISTISRNYDTMTADMYQLVERLNGGEAGVLVRMRNAIDRGRTAAQIAALMRLTVQQTARQEREVHAAEDGRSLLVSQSVSLNDASRVALTEISALGRTVPDTCRQLRRRINGLDLVKLLCRVESGRMGDVDSGMNGIITRLEEAHQSTDRYLSELSAMAVRISSRSKAI